MCGASSAPLSHPSRQTLTPRLTLLILSHFLRLQLKNREPANETSPKYLLLAVPQYFVAFLLLYYACTFRSPASAIRHQLVIDSCIHQLLAMLLQGSILHSTAHMSLSLCCAFPSLWYVRHDL